MNQNEIELFVKNYIRAYLLQIREQNKFSQEKVDTSRRGYVKLESDESCCDAVTLILILFVVEKDPREFISKMREEFFRTIEEIAADPILV